MFWIIKNSLHRLSILHQSLNNADFRFDVLKQVIIFQFSYFTFQEKELILSTWL